MTVTLRSRQRPDNGAPKLGRSVRRIGEESGTLTESSRCDDGQKPDGATKEGQNSRLGKKLKVGTWNVRTIDSCKVDILESEMERMELNALGICEHRWRGQGHFTTSNGGILFFQEERKQDRVE